MKKENTFWKFAVLMAASVPVFVAVDFVFLDIVGKLESSAGGTALALANLLALVLLPYCISRSLQRRDEAAQSEWIAGVSHDIRTPLALVLGSADKLLNECAESAAERSAKAEEEARRVRENAEAIRVQALRIRDLVANLNAENSLSFGRAKKRSAETALANLLREVFSNILNAAGCEKYEAACTVEPSLEGLALKADEALVRRLLENLIGNAVRHNPEGCKISVSLAPAARRGECVLAVCDDGAGVDSAALDMLNSDRSPVSSAGRGMGLRVVKKIARFYRWKLSFASAPDRGFEARVVMRGAKRN